MGSFIVGFLIGSIVTEILMIIYYGSHDEEE